VVVSTVSSIAVTTSTEVVSEVGVVTSVVGVGQEEATLSAIETTVETLECW